MEIFQDNFIDPFALTHVCEHRVVDNTVKLTNRPVFRVNQDVSVSVPPSNDLVNTVVRASCTYASMNLFSGEVEPDRERMFTCTYVSCPSSDLKVLVTNYHNIASHVNGSIFVSYRDTTTKMYVAFCNPDLDIIFLEPEVSTNLHHLESVRVYDNDLDTDIAVYGIVDNVRPYLGLVQGHVDNSTIRVNGRAYAKHSANGIDSMSGGPIITRQGVIGIYNHRAGSVSGSGTYFVPGRVLNRLLRQFVTRRKSRSTVVDRLGQWGIRTQVGNTAANLHNGNTLGNVSVCITHMMPKSALNGDDTFSSIGMLESGDNIVSIDGVFLDEHGVSTNTNHTFVEMIDEKVPGNDIEFRVMRTGTNKVVKHRVENVRPVQVTSEFTNDGYKFFSYGGVHFTQLTMNHVVAMYKYFPHLWAYTDNDVLTTGHVMIVGFDKENIIGPDARLCSIVYSIDSNRIRTLADLHKALTQAAASPMKHVTFTMNPSGNVTVPLIINKSSEKAARVTPPPTTTTPDVDSLVLEVPDLVIDNSNDNSLDNSIEPSGDKSLEEEEEEDDYDYDKWF